MNISKFPNSLTLFLLVANLANSKWGKKNEKWLKPWRIGTHLRALSESYPMNTNMSGFRWFSKIAVSLCFGQSSLSIGLDNYYCNFISCWIDIHPLYFWLNLNKITSKSLILCFEYVCRCVVWILGIKLVFGSFVGIGWGWGETEPVLGARV